MAGWVYLQHGETGGRTRVPDEPGVVEAQEARGWSVIGDPPDPDATEPEPAEPAPVESKPKKAAPSATESKE